MRGALTARCKCAGGGGGCAPTKMPGAPTKVPGAPALEQRRARAATARSDFPGGKLISARDGTIRSEYLVQQPSCNLRAATPPYGRSCRCTFRVPATREEPPRVVACAHARTSAADNVFAIFAGGHAKDLAAYRRIVQSAILTSADSHPSAWLVSGAAPEARVAARRRCSVGRRRSRESERPPNPPKTATPNGNDSWG